MKRVKSSPVVPRSETPETFVNLTDKSWGQLTAIAYLGYGKTGGRAVWLVGCSCGRYEERSAWAICRANPDDRCTPCREGVTTPEKAARLPSMQ
jgi:hypothetical protein